MNYPIGFVAVAISTVAGIAFGVWLARAVRRNQRRRLLEQNHEGYGAYAFPPVEPATSEREDESERKAA